MHLRRLLAVSLLLAWPALAFAANEGWMDDLDAAKAKAGKERKALLLEFTGSTWCGPCKALHGEVLTKPEFTTFSRDFVLVALDYPPMRERTPEKVRANPALARLMAIKEQYAVPGFPTMLLFDADGKELARLVGYDGKGPRAYLAKLGAGRK